MHGTYIALYIDSHHEMAEEDGMSRQHDAVVTASIGEVI